MRSMIDVELDIACRVTGRNDAPESFVDCYKAKIFCFADGDSVEAGVLEYSVVRFEDAINESDFDSIDVLDGYAHSAQYLPLLGYGGTGYPGYSRIVMAITGDILSSNLLTLDTLEILPMYRGARVGLKALALVIQRHGNCGVAVMKPYPLQFLNRKGRDEWTQQMGMGLFSRNENVSTRALRRYYAQLGFRSVHGSSLMVLSPEYDHAALWEKAGVYEETTEFDLHEDRD